MNRRRGCCCDGTTFGPCVEYWRFCLGNDPRTVSVSFESNARVQEFAYCDDGSLSNILISETVQRFSAAATAKWLGNDSNFLPPSGCAIALTGVASGSQVYRSRAYMGQNGLCPEFADCAEQDISFSNVPCAGILRYGGNGVGIPPDILAALSFVTFAPSVLRFVGVCGNSSATGQQQVNGECTAYSKPQQCFLDPQTAGGSINFNTGGGSAAGPLYFQDFQYWSGNILYTNTGSVTLSAQ